MSFGPGFRAAVSIPVTRLLLLLLLLATFVSSQEGTVFWDRCDMDDYYDTSLLVSSNTSTWTRAQLTTLLQSTHRRVLPYTDSTTQQDVWRALMDVDQGDSTNTVRLVYKNIDVSSLEFGTPSTWNREHLWPSSRGVDHNGPDFTDIHHLRPADWNVNAARGNLYFGECGVVEEVDECRVPATTEAAEDTSSDGEVFGPPLINRGDIARALFYMDIRYSGNDGGSDLVLTDCPGSDDDGTMAYLSQLLEWHQEDPPSDRERIRNDRVCEFWQGNRNPFVDYPELAHQLFGLPKTVVSEGAGYTCSAAPPATTVNTTASCSDLQAGDVMVIAMNSDNPDALALVALTDLPPGLQLYATDNAWTGSTFRSNEGTIKLAVPDTGIPRGTVFGYGTSSNLLYGGQWQQEAGTFSLAASGDTVMLYCTEDESATSLRGTNGGDYHFLGAFSYSGDWMAGGLSESTYGTDSSALPSALQKEGATALPHFDNYQYTGPTEGSRTDLLRSIQDAQFWEGSNSEQFSVQTTQFKVSRARMNRAIRTLSVLAMVWIPYVMWAVD